MTDPSDVADPATEPDESDPGAPLLDSDEAVGEDALGEESAEEPVATDDDPVAALAAERDGYLADLQRVSAEFANFRKQTERRNADVAATARGQVVESVLPVFDAFEAAITHGASEVEPIYAALRGALEKVGLELIVPIGESFDPNRHEAVISEEAVEPVAEPVVTEVLRTGYAMAGRILRPAMVKVAT